MVKSAHETLWKYTSDDPILNYNSFIYMKMNKKSSNPIVLQYQFKHLAD